MPSGTNSSSRADVSSTVIAPTLRQERRGQRARAAGDVERPVVRTPARTTPTRPDQSRPAAMRGVAVGGAVEAATR